MNHNAQQKYSPFYLIIAFSISSTPYGKQHHNGGAILHGQVAWLW